MVQTIILDTDEYYFLDQETFVMCNETYINSIMPLELAQSTYSYKLIISLVCISLSRFALAVSLIIYALVDQLKKSYSRYKFYVANVFTSSCSNALPCQ